MAKEDYRITSNCRCPRAPPIRRRPIGPALGQRGLNIMEFCKAFNAQSAQMEKGAPRFPVVITVYAGPFLHLRDEDSRRSPSSSRRPRTSSSARSRLRARRPPVASTVGQVTKSAGPWKSPKRRSKDSELRHSVDAAMRHDRRFRPFDGPRGGGVTIMAHVGKRSRTRPVRVSIASSSTRSMKRSSS